MTILDIVIVILFLVSIITGFKTGALKELVSLIGTILIFILAYLLKGVVGNFLCLILPFFIKDLITVNIILYQLIAFILIYGILSFIYNLVLKLSGFIDKIISKTIILKIPFKLLGSVISLVKMYIVIFLILIILLIPFRNTTLIKNSYLSNIIVYKTPILSKSTTKITSILKEIIDVDQKIYNNKISKNEANLEILDLLLKYNMIDKDTVLKLYNMGKIKEIKDIENVVYNY